MRIQIVMGVLVASAGIRVGIASAEDLERSRVTRPALSVPDSHMTAGVGVGSGPSMPHALQTSSAHMVTAGATAGLTTPGHQGLGSQVSAIHEVAPHNDGALRGTGGMVSGIATEGLQRPGIPAGAAVSRPSVQTTTGVSHSNLQRRSGF